jgi:hypothetical protein
MADIVWPINLPQKADQSSYQEGRVKNKIESPVEQGRPLTRRRFTASTQKFQIVVQPLTEAQTALLDEFFYETAKDGVLVFDWVHPRTQIAAECQFTGDPPSYAPAGGLMYRASFQMLILP